MSTIDDPRRVPTESGLATARANPTTTTTTTAAIAAAVKELATQYFHNTPEEKMVIFTGIITRHLQPLLAKVEIDAYSMQVLFEQVATALDVSTLTAADRGHDEMLCDILDVIDTREKRLAKVEGERDQSARDVELYSKVIDRHAAELAALRADLAAAKAEVSNNMGEWATLMSDVHDYFADEKADRSGGRVRLVLTLLGMLRIDRDQLKADLAAKEVAWQPIETAPKDGFNALFYLQSRGVEIGHWDDDKYAKKPRPFWIRRSVWGVSADRAFPPTHWMRLPEFPALASRADKGGAT